MDAKLIKAKMLSIAIVVFKISTIGTNTAMKLPNYRHTTRFILCELPGVGEI